MSAAYGLLPCGYQTSFLCMPGPAVWGWYHSQWGESPNPINHKSRQNQAHMSTGQSDRGCSTADALSSQMSLVCAHWPKVASGEEGGGLYSSDVSSYCYIIINVWVIGLGQTDQWRRIDTSCTIRYDYMHMYTYVCKQMKYQVTLKQWAPNRNL